MRQVGRTVQDKHRTAVLKVGNSLTGPLHQQDIARTQANQVQVPCYLSTACPGAMQRQRQQTVATTEAHCSEAAQMQRRTASDNNLGQLLALCLKRCFVVDWMLGIRNIEQRRTKHLFVVLQVLGGVLDEQPVAGL